jgi:sec-independent protein translocase protein TatB
MFEIGFSEIVLIFGLALVVLGPEKLPRLAANIGRWVGRARGMARQFREQLESEAETLKSSVSEAEKSIQSSLTDVQSAVSEAQTAVKDAESAVTDASRQYAEGDRQLDMPLETPTTNVAPNPPATEVPDELPTPGSPAANHSDLGQHERGT